MERRFRSGMKEMPSQAEVPSDLIDGLMSRLEAFVPPYSAALSEPEQRQHSDGLLYTSAAGRIEGQDDPQF